MIGLQIFRDDVVVLQGTGSFHQGFAHKSASLHIGPLHHFPGNGFGIQFAVSVNDDSGNRPLEHSVAQPDLFQHGI